MTDWNPSSLEACLARMETQQQVNSNILVEIKATMAKQEARIEALENFRYWLLGAVGAGSTAGGLALSKLFGG